MTIERVSFNVRRITEEVLDCVAPKADERGVELVCDVAGPLLSDGVVLCDAGRFRQVLLNIVGKGKGWWASAVDIPAHFCIFNPPNALCPNPFAG